MVGLLEIPTGHLPGVYCTYVWYLGHTHEPMTYIACGEMLLELSIGAIVPNITMQQYYRQLLTVSTATVCSWNVGS